MVERTQIIHAVTAAITQAPERKFQESIDITINLKHVDMAQPKNRIDETILLPQAIGVKKIAVLGKGDIVSQARNAGVDLLSVLTRSSVWAAFRVKHAKWPDSMTSSLQRLRLCPLLVAGLVRDSVPAVKCRSRFRRHRTSLRSSSV